MVNSKVDNKETARGMEILSPWFAVALIATLMALVAAGAPFTLGGSPGVAKASPGSQTVLTIAHSGDLRGEVEPCG